MPVDEPQFQSIGHETDALKRIGSALMP